MRTSFGLSVLAIGWLLTACSPTQPAPETKPAPSQVSAEPAVTTQAPPVTPMENEAPVTMLEITLTHDIVCPWCRLGHVRLMKAIEASGLKVKVNYHPYLLEPNMAEEGVDFQANMTAKFGAEQMLAAQQRLTALGAEDGVAFHFDRIKRSTPTLKAHVLIGAAPADKQTAFLDALHIAYFEQGKPLADHATLLEAWTSVGLDAAEAERLLKDQALLASVRAQAEQAARSGVRGVPQMAIGKAILQGAQPVDVIKNALLNAR